MHLPARLNFQTKVLLPVMSIMVLLIAVPMWIVSRRMSLQLETSAAESLTTADAVFRNLQSMHARNLRLRYANLPNEPRFKAVLQLSDRETIAGVLKDYLEELGGDVAIFGNDQAKRVAEFSRDAHINLDEFAARSGDVIEQALHGEPGASCGTTVGVSGRLYDVLSIPVSLRDQVLGTLTFGIEMGDEVVREFKQITRSEILLFAGEQIAATTVAPADWSVKSSASVHQLVLGQGDDAERHEPRPQTVLLNGEHFMVAARRLGEKRRGPRLEVVLLSSYQKSLEDLQATQRTFLWVQLAGILLGGASVWFLVRRVTSPLRQLRDSAEAVGRGDFSRRVEIRARDECGELAGVFNRMTANLRTSREELERTVETLKATQTQLIQSEKLRAIGTLAGGIAHDFNNILGAILGFGELALDDVPAESRTARNLRQVVKAGHRAKDLVRQILAFSRQDQPQRSNVRLSAIVDETLKLLRATIPSTVQIKNCVRTEADTVTADPSQLHQVLMNLGTNASHAMQETGGSLTVTLEDFLVPESGTGDTSRLPPGDYLRLSVADTGHGMPRDVLERIFEPFFTTKPVGEGTGLGLSVVHGIVKSHGGEITVTSQPGVGTTFFLFLPRAAGAEIATSQDEQSVPGQAERILVVDDEEPLVNLMQQKLTRLGYEVVAHCDSLAALKEFRAAPMRFDVVITDQTMPHLTGADLAQEIIDLRPDTPIIMCSGSGNALLTGDEACAAVRQRIPKPINFAELSRRIRQVLEADRSPSLKKTALAITFST